MISCADLSKAEKMYLLNKTHMAYHYDRGEWRMWRRFHDGVSIDGILTGDSFPVTLYQFNSRWEEIIKNDYHKLEESRMRYLRSRSNGLN